MYQALYRKWRPQTFDQVVGQPHITETLKNQVRTGRLSHSYIFIGTRGTGKTTCARILAKAVNCHAPENGNPCGKCPACMGIADGSVLDVVELDAASNNGVDNVRALREEAVFSPASVRKRVYIIDEVHMLSGSAFNALLKILEEPPEHLMFILATTELHKVPATILSRCQRHSFRRPDVGQIASYLEYIAAEEKIALSPDAAQLLAGLAEGGIRDALSLLDQCSAHEKIDSEAVYSALGLAGRLRMAEMLDAILRHDMLKVLRDFDALWRDGKDCAGFLRELSELVRDVLMVKVAPRGGAEIVSGSFGLDRLRAFAAAVSKEELISMMETIQRHQNSLRDSGNPRNAVELCLVSLCDDTLGESVNALRSRIARLEARLDRGDFPAASPAGSYEPAPEAPFEEEELPPPPWEDEPPVFEEYREERPLEAPPETAAEEEAPAFEPAAPAAAPKDPDISWKDICARAADQLPRSYKAYFDDESQLSGSLEGNVLNLRAAPGFVYGRINRQDVLAAFAAAASELAGREVRSLLSEAKKDEGAQRSVDELRAFEGLVKFI